MKLGCLLFDSSGHYIDHLAPLCLLLNCPLITCDARVHEIAAKHYPGLKVLQAPHPVGFGEWLSKQFTHIVSCWSTVQLQNWLGSFTFETLWLPHGNSDKGQIFSYYPALNFESTLLIYGQKMADTLHANGVFSKKTIQVGAHRKLYYELNRSFYDSIDLGITFLNPNLPILLYAPTWDDFEHNCSFWEALPILSKTLPSTINLLVKPHPNTVSHMAPKLELYIGKYSRGNLQFLLDFYLIYPLLSRISALLGDRSSVGYDFLHFDRPMLFLDPHDSPKGRDLLSCGLNVRPEEVFTCDWNQDRERLSRERKKMASYAFTPLTHKELKTNIETALESSKKPLSTT